MLLEIIEPSRTIEEKYMKVMLELEDDIYISGNIVAEDNASLTIQTGIDKGTEKKVAKNLIVGRRLSPVSIMPVGLLNKLDKEQILDLLAYVLASGNAQHDAFKK